jgi:S1 RNA binding domain protein
MSEELVGQTLEGDVTNVTRFGAFVRLSDGQEGLVHISEVANEFITDINAYVKPGERVTVKVLSRNDKGQLELSIKRTKEKEQKPGLFINARTKDNSFEEKMSLFLKKSEEKQIDIRRNLKNKQGIAKKKK